MKRHILYIVACLALFGCSDTYDEGLGLTLSETPRFLDVSQDRLRFDARPQAEQKLIIKSIQTPWKLINDSKWITLSVESMYVTGEKSTEVSVLASENESGDTARSHIIFLESTASDWKASVPIIVTQSVATPYIMPEQTNVELSGKKQEYVLSVQSNTNWHCESSESWLKARRVGDDLLIDVEGNNSTLARKAEVVLSGADNASIAIEQEPANVHATTDTIEFDRVAGTYTLAIEADLLWQAYTNESWIQVSPVSGEAGENMLEISVTPNNSTSDRYGNVYVVIETMSLKIPVFQHSYYTKTEQNEIVFGSHGGAMVLTVSSNDSWKGSVVANDWLTLSESSGVGSKELTLVAKENATLNRRSVFMLIISDNSDDIPLGIVQNPRYLVPSSNAVSFFGKGGTETIHISTDGKYNVEKSGDWFMMTQNGDDIVVSAPENNTDAWRSGSITITLTDLKEGELFVVIPVEQALNGQIVNIKDYEDDEDWNDDKSDWIVKISVVGYRNDEEWSTNPDKAESDIGMDEYEPDSDVTTENTPSWMIHVLYDSMDTDWSSNPDKNKSDVSHSDYSDDNEITNEDDKNQIGHSDFSTDEDWTNN